MWLCLCVLLRVQTNLFLSAATGPPRQLSTDDSSGHITEPVSSYPSPPSMISLALCACKLISFPRALMWDRLFLDLMLVNQPRLSTHCSLSHTTRSWFSSQPHSGQPGLEDPRNNGSRPPSVVGRLECPGSLLSPTKARNEADLGEAWGKEVPEGIEDLQLSSQSCHHTQKSLAKL